MQPVKLLERAAGTAFHAVRHPVSTASYAVGIARGLAGAAIQVARPHGQPAGHSTADVSVPEQPRPDETADSATPGGIPEPQRVGKPMPPPYATDEMREEMIVIEPEPAHESFATEPKAVSRDSAHGEGVASDAEIDAWLDEAVQRDDGPAVGTPSAEQPADEPGLDPGTAKGLRKESETLRKAAERDPE
jgi:hypothetical protein